MDEIGDKVFETEKCEDPRLTKRIELLIECVELLEKRLLETSTLALSNQRLIEGLSENQTELFKLMERHFG